MQMDQATPSEMRASCLHGAFLLTIIYPMRTRSIRFTGAGISACVSSATGVAASILSSAISAPGGGKGQHRTHKRIYLYMTEMRYFAISSISAFPSMLSSPELSMDLKPCDFSLALN